MEILHIAPTPFFADRGCHIRIAGVVRCLSELGHRNTVCTYHHGRDVGDIETVRIGNIKRYAQTEAGPNRYKPWADLKLLWVTLREYRRRRPDVLHAHLHEGLCIALIVKTLFFWRRTPLIADIQGSLTGELASYGVFKKLKPLQWLCQQFEKVLLFFPTHIICSSPHSLDKLRYEFAVPKNRLSLVQDGANTHPPIGSEQKQARRHELGITNDTVVVVYSGALLESKGLINLKRLMVNTQGEQTLHFLIIGYPQENIQPFLEKHQLQEFCTLTGRVNFENLPAWLSSADIAIDPKNSDAGEGSGKMMNYLACGLPIVAFDSTNNRAFLPPQYQLANDLNNMTELLLELSKDKQKRATLGLQARSHFDEHYSWRQTRIQLRSTYQALAKD